MLLMESGVAGLLSRVTSILLAGGIDGEPRRSVISGVADPLKCLALMLLGIRIADGGPRPAPPPPPDATGRTCGGTRLLPLAVGAATTRPVDAVESILSEREEDRRLRRSYKPICLPVRNLLKCGPHPLPVSLSSFVIDGATDEACEGLLLALVT